ncbi:MAG: hypothetical protein JWM16_836 [Verrucomicrobiales bacterium]|nr:hypothetical protein [Verrucomicrobiales bacterium]
MRIKTQGRSRRGTTITDVQMPRSRRLRIRGEDVSEEQSQPSLSTPQRLDIKAARRKFLKFFPNGFKDETYKAWERDYKWNAHLEWNTQLAKPQLRTLLKQGRDADAAMAAVRIESRTNLLFSFEKMALRDAVKSNEGAQLFAEGLYDFLYGSGTPGKRFERWCEVVAGLPRKQTRVLTWPVVTVFGFIAQPEQHMFVKPNVTKLAAQECGFDFQYASRPSWKTYVHILDFASEVKRIIRDLKARDFIDIQSFLWVQGSTEYD